MKIIAYYALHYGVEWLSWSMRSVKDHVDDIVVLYSHKPSHGHGTNHKNPEPVDPIRQISKHYGAHWQEVDSFNWEGAHRDEAVRLCRTRGADLVLVVDADEIWDENVLQCALRYVKQNRGKHSWRIGMRHFWRSLQWICDDPAMPVRVIDPEGKGEGYIGACGKVYHMGYAQSPSLIKYKMSIHGHKAEIRPNWFGKVFLPWSPGRGDVHPTNQDFWYPKEFDTEKIQHLVGDHPYWDTEIIE